MNRGVFTENQVLGVDDNVRLNLDEILLDFIIKSKDLEQSLDDLITENKYQGEKFNSKQAQTPINQQQI